MRHDVDSTVVIGVRTCVGCRGRESKADLLRLAIVGGRIIVDVRQTVPGRGAYLHRHPDCWHRAIRQRSVARGLRAVQADSSELFDALAAAAGETITTASTQIDRPGRPGGGA